MSVAKKSNHRAQRSQSAPAPALNTAMGLLILTAAMVTGLLLSMMSGAIAWPFLLCFVVAAIALSLFIEKPGLFILVSSLPLFFFASVLATGWLIARGAAPEGASPFSKTILLTSAFPLVENFPALALGTGGALIIALLRLWRDRARLRSHNEQARRTRRAAAEADRKAKSERLSVAEILARNEAAKQATRTTAAPRPSSRQWGKDREQRRREQAAERKDRLRQAPPQPDPHRRAGDNPPPPRPSHRLQEHNEEGGPTWDRLEKE